MGHSAAGAPLTSGSVAGAAAVRDSEPTSSLWEWCAAQLHEASLLLECCACRELLTAKVSAWIQSSPQAWSVCFRAIACLVVLHAAAQTWLALPCGVGAVQWHTCRRLCLVHTGTTALVAFASLHVQVRGLAGTQGIVPFPRRAAERIARSGPDVTLLDWGSARADPAAWLARCANVLESRWWAHGCRIEGRGPSWWTEADCGLTDSKLTQLCWLGEAAAAAVVVASLLEGALRGRGALGFAAEALLGLLRVTALAMVTLSYRSLKGCADVFTGLQWDSLVVEATLLAVPLAPPFLPNCWVPALLLPHQVLAFRCMFGSGVVKRRSRCPRWASSTAMDLHYETQPIPHLLSWYAHKLPGWWHAQECWVAFLTQLPLTFLQWGTWHCRLVNFCASLALMVTISATGNFGFFNFQVLGLAVSALDDSLIPLAMPPPFDPLAPSVALALLPAVAALGLWIAAAGWVALLQLPRMGASVLKFEGGSAAAVALGMAEKAHAALRPLGVGGSYGPFAGMTTFRWELIFELGDENGCWTELEFPYKPGRVDARPRWMPFGHFARLDWRLWFVPLGMGRGYWELPDWVQRFILQLLRGSEHVAALTLHGGSIVASPPKRVRVSVWDYHFSSCDPSVHRCPQVTLTLPERDAGYLPASSWWDAPLPRHSFGGCQGRDECLRSTSACQADGRGGPPTEWGRWWYRRHVACAGVFLLRDGELCVQEGSVKRYQR